MVGEVIEASVDVNVGRWVDKRTCATLDLCVVPLSIEKQLNLFHVGSPVNLGVLKRAEVSSVSASSHLRGSLTGHLGNHQRTQGCIQENQHRWNKPGQPMPPRGDILCESKELQVQWVLLGCHGAGFLMGDY